RGSTAIYINNDKEIAGIKAACKLGREALDYAHTLVKPGITTDYIDKMVHQFIINKNAYPSPLNYKFFPKSLCTSVNEVICHGIPDDRALVGGDIVNLDVTIFLDGVHGDTNATFPVGRIDPASQRLVRVTRECLERGIDAV